ncbi:hypothetical protein QM565_27730 [Geitlerinema splendidum]|jgi:hypothetical protein|nr:hypothetical protein [Geitlerinema splendidum]
MQVLHRAFKARGLYSRAVVQGKFIRYWLLSTFVLILSFGITPAAQVIHAMEVVAFYQDQIATRGGQVSSMMSATDQLAMLDVRQGNQSLMVMIGAAGTMTTVNITSLTGSPLPPPTMCVPGTPAAS